MTVERKRQSPASSGAKGRNLHQKMEDARARRAEVLALKTPANVDASTPKPGPAPLSSEIAGQPPEPIEAPVPRPEPAAAEPAPHEPPKPLSRSLPRTASEPRFPAIVMPDADDHKEPKAHRPNRRKVALPAALLLAVIFAVLYFVPKAENPIDPLAEQSITAPSPPLGALDTLLSSPDTAVDREKSRAGISIPEAKQITMPQKGTLPTRPKVQETAQSTRSTDLFEQPPTAPQQVTLWQSLPLPLMPRAPEADPLFALPLIDNLNISLIIPAQAAHGKLRDVSTALKDSGFRINEPRLVSYAISTTHVRYYNEADARAAALLAQNIGGDVRDFTEYASPPPEGSVEVFVQSQAPSEIPRPVLRGAAQDLGRFGAEINDTLRAITR